MSVAADAVGASGSPPPFSTSRVAYSVAVIFWRRGLAAHAVAHDVAHATGPPTLAQFVFVAYFSLLPCMLYGRDGLHDLTYAVCTRLGLRALLDSSPSCHTATPLRPWRPAHVACACARLVCHRPHTRQCCTFTVCVQCPLRRLLWSVLVWGCIASQVPTLPCAVLHACIQQCANARPLACALCAVRRFFVPLWTEWSSSIGADAFPYRHVSPYLVALVEACFRFPPALRSRPCGLPGQHTGVGDGSLYSPLGTARGCAPVAAWIWPRGRSRGLIATFWGTEFTLL